MSVMLKWTVLMHPAGLVTKLRSLHLRKRHWTLTHQVELLAVLQGLKLFRIKWSSMCSSLRTTPNTLGSQRLTKGTLKIL